MMEFMNFVRTTSPYLASGMISRFSALWRRDMALSLLRTLRAVFRTALLAVLDALGVENAAQDVIAHARKVLDAAAADHDDRVLLQVMALARDVADDLEAVGQTHLGDLAQCRVRLLRRRRIDTRADAALLRAALHMAGFFAVCLLLPRLADQLTDCRHSWPFEKRTFEPQLPRAE